MNNQDIKDAQALPINPKVGINETLSTIVSRAPKILIIAPIAV